MRPLYSTRKQADDDGRHPRRQPTWLLTGLGEGPLEQTTDSDPGDLRQAVREMSQDIENLSRRMRELASRLGGEAGAAA